MSVRHIQAVLCWFAGVVLLAPCAVASTELDYMVNKLPECAVNSQSETSCARAVERLQLVKNRKFATRTNDVLTVQTAKKQLKWVDDYSDSYQKFIVYSYLGFNPKLRVHVIHLNYYEGDAYMVIDHRTGQLAYPSGFPVWSPDGTHFLSVSQDMFASFNPNNVEIWELNSGKFVRLFNLEPEWGPGVGKWIAPHTIQVEKFCYEDSTTLLANSATLTPCGTAKIHRSGRKWVLIP